MGSEGGAPQTTLTSRNLDTKISPDFAPTDASKGPSDGITLAPILETIRKAPIPPQQWLQLAETEPLQTSQHCYARLFPTNDMTDPLSWLSGCEFFFRGQHTPNNKKIGCAIFHLINIAQIRYMHSTENQAATNVEHSDPPTTPPSTSPPNSRRSTRRATTNQQLHQL